MVATLADEAKSAESGIATRILRHDPEGLNAILQPA
jgi:hypothetical protein